MTDNMPDVHPYLKEDQRRAVSQPADMDKVREALEYCQENTFRIGGEVGNLACEAEVKRLCREQHRVAKEALAILDQQKPATPEMTDAEILEIASLFLNYGIREDGIYSINCRKEDIISFVDAIIKAVK